MWGLENSQFLGSIGFYTSRILSFVKRRSPTEILSPSSCSRVLRPLVLRILQTTYHAIVWMAEEDEPLSLPKSSKGIRLAWFRRTFQSSNLVLPNMAAMPEVGIHRPCGS